MEMAHFMTVNLPDQITEVSACRWALQRLRTCITHSNSTQATVCLHTSCVCLRSGRSSFLLWREAWLYSVAPQTHRPYTHTHPPQDTYMSNLLTSRFDCLTELEPVCGCVCALLQRAHLVTFINGSHRAYSVLWCDIRSAAKSSPFIS